MNTPTYISRHCLLIALLLALFVLPDPGLLSAAEATPAERTADLEAYLNNAARSANTAVNVAGPGHNAWMMTSSALVLFMTLPGLALFYGGLVRRKNVLSVVAQCMGLACIVPIIWWAIGYSLCFAKGNAFLGGLDHVFLRGVDITPNGDYSTWVSHNIWAMYQLMFAIITPALIVGAIAERMKFAAVMLFCVLWLFVVYFPAAHMIWGAGGWMNGIWNADAPIKSIDFAGGIVVHMTSGWSALVLCILLGKRLGHGKEPMPPHSMVLCAIGTGMLWVGWYGFNAGSAVAADGIAANAFVATTLSAAAGGATWASMEYWLRGKPSILGLCSGAVAGLATITPASGFVTANSAILIGLLAGASTFLACSKLKQWLRYDDSLDTFGVHAVGGTLGTLMAGFCADAKINPNLSTNLGAYLGKTLWLEQVKAALIVLVWSVVATVVIFYLVRAVLGTNRVDPETERAGLDLAEHGEEGYNE
ncbi:MAG: ammonium transporter [Verrucomicrobia bacterium]|nr:ammonium transporter [Verrucomicrobiota bacterium]